MLYHVCHSSSKFAATIAAFSARHGTGLHDTPLIAVIVVHARSTDKAGLGVKQSFIEANLHQYAAHQISYVTDLANHSKAS
jgi:hypothetical protein